MCRLSIGIGIGTTRAPGLISEAYLSVCTKGYGFGPFSLQARAPRRPRSIMMSPVVVNQDQLVSISPVLSVELTYRMRDN